MKRQVHLDLQGTLKGAPYRIVVPENWNGTLLVYAPGYSQAQDPEAMPEAAFLAGDQLLQRGYALAASGLRSGGHHLDQFVLDLKYLTDFFRKEVGKPNYTLHAGSSCAL